MEGRYEPLAIEKLEDGVLQGDSATLNLFIRRDRGRLAWHDPATGRHILTYDDQHARAEVEQGRAESAEARIRDLEEENRRLRGG